MNRIKYIIPSYISSFILAAHFFRHGQYFFVLFWIIIPFVLLIENKGTIRAIQILMILGSVIWMFVAVDLIQLRVISKMPWIRMAVILVSVSIFTLFSSVLIEFYYRKFIR